MQKWADNMQTWCRVLYKCASGTLFCYHTPIMLKMNKTDLMHTVTVCRVVQTLCRLYYISSRAMCWPTDHPKKPVTGWVECAPSLQSLHLSHLVHTLCSARGIPMHTICRPTPYYMHTLYIYYADYVNTLCTLCAHFVQTVTWAVPIGPSDCWI